MSIFGMFADRTTPVKVNGKRDEVAIITRRGKTISPQAIQNERMCRLQDDTVYESGDLMMTPDNKYYIVAKQKAQTNSVQAHLRKVNTEVCIARIEVDYDSKGNKTGEKESIIYEHVPSVQYTVSANMKLYDAGLLPNTIKKYIVPVLDIKLKDRIKIDGKKYEVLGIDDDKYENIFVIQCGVDTRK